MEFEEEYDEVDNLISSGATSEQHANPEKYIFAVDVTDNLRQTFILVILVGNFLSVNIAVTLMCLAWFVRSSVEKHMTFLQDFYNPHAIPAMVGLSGLAMLVASVLGVKAGIWGRTTEEEDEKPAADFMFVYVVAAAVTSGAVLIASLACFVDIAVLNAALGEGLTEGMKKYKEVSQFKPEIDALQMNYKCCGSSGYKSWYNVSWVASKYLDTGDGIVRQSMKENHYKGKDVPFSCCRMGVMRPCVDTRVEDNSYHSKYQFPTDLTLYSRGCKEAVSSFIGHTVFKGVGLFLFFCSLLWMTLAAIGRYLNTSMTNTSLGEPPVGWLIPYTPAEKSVFSKLKRTPGDEEESAEFE